VKQREQLSSPMPIMKQAAVRFTVAAKPVTMRQDLIDAAGLGIAGGVGLGVGGPVEMLLRANIHFSKQLNIPVKDWESCDGGWAGTVSYSMTYHYVHNAQTTFTEVSGDDQTMQDEIRLRGNANAGTGWVGSSLGSYTVAYGKKFRATDTWPPTRFGGSTTITGEENASASGGGEASVEIGPRGDNKYEIHSTVGSVSGVDLWHYSCSGDCKGKTTPDSSKQISYSPFLPKVMAQEEPDQPGVLRGSTTFEDLPTKFATTKVSWNLKQCQDRR